MAKIRADDLIDLFERMAREHWAYEWGAAREGCVDCSGAFVYAYRALGGPSIAHGSNTIARKSCGEMAPASEAKPGYAVFRWREDGEPERYENDGRDDYYHIGLMGRNGTVLNAKSTAAGFVESPLTGWAYAAPLLDVSYGAEDALSGSGGDTSTAGESETLPAVCRAVVSTSRDPLNLRDEPGPGGRKIGKLPRGAVVDVLDTAVNAGWWRVRHDGLVGYASCDYLRRIDEQTEEAEGVEIADGVTAEAITATTLVREDAEGCVTLIGRWRVAED